MNDYWLYLLISAVTITSPGPGVVSTLTNSVRFGVRGALPGIVGLTLGSLVIAAIAATGLGLLLVSSALAFTIVKFAGAVYLVCIGVSLWLSASEMSFEDLEAVSSPRSIFFQGALIQILNPKAILFFISIFPQFIDYSTDVLARFLLLIASYCVLIVLIHSVYALLAGSVRHLLRSPGGVRLTRRTAGTSYLLFGVGLATTGR